MEENRLKGILINIWPMIYRILNSILYFIIGLIKTVLSIAFRQLKQGG
ncbi:MAG: hypothetical protein HYT08_02530 [Candidatus Levybacteria bacterium]|nr:hypothetical protein [Candidatus Levybacteria bacterium]